MLLKAGLLSLLLLLASRVMGVLRETALAASLGSSGMADVALVMLTLPDWLAGVLASGALAYVLLPHWAALAPAQQNAVQRRVARHLLMAAVVLASALCLAPATVAAVLVPGLPPTMRASAAQAVMWSALALPAAMLAGLWATRLQHERDFVGLYSANLIINAVLIAGLLVVGMHSVEAGSSPLLGGFLLLAVALRLLWQGWRLRLTQRGSLSQERIATAQPAALVPGPGGVAPHASAALPGWRVWMWAALGAGLPLTLPFVSRSVASGSGEGALATFNYAWKLVELPLVLAIQLVATLSFPAIAQAHARATATAGNSPSAHGGSVAAGAPADARDAMDAAVRSALALAWTLACAAAAALLVGAPAIATLLFGWGRMEGPALELIGAWARVGAWGLLPQALLAVALTVLASVGRMRFAVLAYGVALALLLGAAAAGVQSGHALMWVLNIGFTAAAMVAWVALGPTAVRCWVDLRTVLAPLLALLLVAVLARWWTPETGSAGAVENFDSKLAPALFLSGLGALIVVASSWLCSTSLRQALRS